MMNGLKISARTCAEWDACVERGGYPLTTFDIAMASWFDGGALLLSNLPHMSASTQSAFAGVPFETYAPLVSDVHRDAVLRGEVRNSIDSRADGVGMDISKDRIEIDDGYRREVLDVIARGDFDGDGWEDLLVSGMVYATQGSLRYPTRALMTRRGDGPMMDITPLLCDRPPCESEIAWRRALIRDSFGLPQGSVARLTGTISSASGGVGEPIEMQLLVYWSLVEAQVSCANRSNMKFVGCVGFDHQILLRPVSGSEAPWAEWRLEWRPFADGIEVEGEVERTGDGTLRVKLHASFAQVAP